MKISCDIFQKYLKISWDFFKKYENTSKYLKIFLKYLKMSKDFCLKISKILFKKI